MQGGAGSQQVDPLRSVVQRADEPGVQQVVVRVLHLAGVRERGHPPGQRQVPQARSDAPVKCSGEQFRGPARLSHQSGQPAAEQRQRVPIAGRHGSAEALPSVPQSLRGVPDLVGREQHDNGEPERLQSPSWRGQHPTRGGHRGFPLSSAIGHHDSHKRVLAVGTEAAWHVDQLAESLPVAGTGSLDRRGDDHVCLAPAALPGQPGVRCPCFVKCRVHRGHIAAVISHISRRKRVRCRVM